MLIIIFFTFFFISSNPLPKNLSDFYGSKWINEKEKNIIIYENKFNNEKGSWIFTNYNGNITFDFVKSSDYSVNRFFMNIEDKSICSVVDLVKTCWILK